MTRKPRRDRDNLPGWLEYLYDHPDGEVSNEDLYRVVMQLAYRLHNVELKSRRDTYYPHVMDDVVTPARNRYSKMIKEKTKAT
jgi:hypothetical protein